MGRGGVGHRFPFVLFRLKRNRCSLWGRAAGGEGKRKTKTCTLGQPLSRELGAGTVSLPTYLLSNDERAGPPTKKKERGEREKESLLIRDF